MNRGSDLLGLFRDNEWLCRAVNSRCRRFMSRQGLDIWKCIVDIYKFLLKLFRTFYIITRRLLRRSHWPSLLVKYHRNILKNIMKYIDVPHFLTAITLWSQTCRVRYNKNPYKTNKVQRYLIEKHRKTSSACAVKYNKIRPTITASKICNVVKYGTRSG